MNTTEITPPSFFFDTADTEAIKRIWEKLKKNINQKSCLGITTNPSALTKVNCHTIKDLETLVKTITALRKYYEIRK